MLVDIIFLYLCFFLLQFLSVVLAPIPSNITAAAGGVLFGTWPSFFLTFAAVVAGSLLLFWLARVLGREVTTDLNYEGDLPPIAHIKGLDLVTEGVLTLRQANALITRFLADPADADTLKELDKPNGAAQIAHILLERCTHLYLFIGKAINPAHQNPQLPVDLSIKIRLLEDLAETLRGAGKVVQIKYY